MLKTVYTALFLLLLSQFASAASPPPANAVSVDTFPGPFFEPPETDSKQKALPKITQEQMLQRIDEADGDTIKLDAKGNVLDSEAVSWDCVHQKSSGLTWEVKTTTGLRDKTNAYTWIDSQSVDTTLLSWFKNSAGKCVGDSRCDTAGYTEMINHQRLCNFKDWRLPTKTELERLIKMDQPKQDAKINTIYFPNTLPSWYWTADTNEDIPDYVWYVLFKNGSSLSDKKDSPKHIRLVRGSL